MSQFNIGDELRVIPGAKYISGNPVPEKIINSKVYLRGFDKHQNLMIGLKPTGAISGSVKEESVIPYVKDLPRKYTFKKYHAIVISDTLNIREEPSPKAKIVRKAVKNNIFIIGDEEEGWGQISSGEGWINLDYVTAYKE